MTPTDLAALIYEVPPGRVARLRGGGSRTELVELAGLVELVGRDTALTAALIHPREREVLGLGVSALERW